MFWGNFVKRRKMIKDEQTVKLGRGAAWGIQRVRPKNCRRGSIPLVLQRSQSEDLKVAGTPGHVKTATFRCGEQALQ